MSEASGMIKHAQNPSVVRRARDFYAVYCASSDGKNYQGLACPEWEKLTDAVRGHWYTVALRSVHLEANEVRVGLESEKDPSEYVVGHLGENALGTWKAYSGL